MGSAPAPRQDSVLHLQGALPLDPGRALPCTRTLFEKAWENKFMLYDYSPEVFLHGEYFCTHKKFPDT